MQMSYLHCPYCEIKENAKIMTHYEALQPINGKCPDCSAFIDVGQKKIDVNGYTDIYNGVVRIVEDVIQQINNLMYYLEVDTEIDGEIPHIRLNTSDIVEKIFIPYSGGTSKNNFKNAIGIEDDTLEFEIKAEQYEW